MDVLSAFGIPPTSPDPSKNIFGFQRPFGLGVPQDTPPAVLKPRTIYDDAPASPASSIAAPVTETPAPAAPGGAFGAGFMTRLGLGIMARANPAAIASQTASARMTQAPLATAARGVEDYGRGLVGAPALPPPVASAAPVTPKASPISTVGVQPGIGAPAVPAPTPVAAPIHRGFSNLTPASAAAVAAFLPRQRMPQEIAGDTVLSALANQRDMILQDATRSAAEKATAVQRYIDEAEKMAQYNQAGNLQLMQQLMGGGVP